jgi:uncharacterized membrane protein YciS (DUF1049 family)
MIILIKTWAAMFFGVFAAVIVSGFIIQLKLLIHSIKQIREQEAQVSDTTGDEQRTKS